MLTAQKGKPTRQKPCKQRHVSAWKGLAHMHARCGSELSKEVHVIGKFNSKFYKRRMGNSQKGK